MNACRLSLAAALVLAATSACGITPTNVVTVGDAPVIRTRPQYSDVYLLRAGRLVLNKVRVPSNSLADHMRVLFDIANQTPAVLREDGDLSGLSLREADPRVFGTQPQRTDPGVRGLRLHVYLEGDKKLSEAGLAQIVCTARLRPEVWEVRVSQFMPGKSPKSWGKHTCREFHHLAPQGAPP
ncbi:hypothetical protein [Nonomuraea sp. NPDC046570]|uniref:hypothetical protein n=1 Tax=Nonomuraea sp. NPDC046570 TaxID=3155255 RepID=UPI0033F08ED0